MNNIPVAFLQFLPFDVDAVEQKETMVENLIIEPCTRPISLQQSSIRVKQRTTVVLETTTSCANGATTIRKDSVELPTQYFDD